MKPHLLDEALLPDDSLAPSHNTNEPAELAAIGSTARRDDNRRRCCECAKLGQGGRCLAAVRREIVASPTYAPHPDWLRRCEAFAPMPNDPDQRPGRDRWPGLCGERE